ncbi:MAG TPA: flagellar hook-length control protein FliK [Burkholderiales bacterium]|nr:flagellar hook-length control protein FliK [Burkholderiales bacterium]
MTRLLGATPVAAVDPVAALHRSQADGDDAPARLVPGTRLFVQVMEPLIDGGVRARVVDSGAEHRLPFDAKPGARLHVLVAGTDAQPTLLLSEAESGGASASLSQAARMLAALAPAGAQPARPAVVAAAAPLLPGPGVDAAELSRALAQTLAQSGLFYESHQAQWVSGARDRDALLDEPQARLALRDAGGDAYAPRASDAPAAASELNGVVHRDTVGLVQQQLAALESGAIVWRGQPWRGQPMEWTVQRDGVAHDEDHGSYGKWFTRVRLTLPQLGGIDALLAVDARGLDMRIAAADAKATDALRAAMPSLAAALAQAGLNLRRLEVQRGP